MDKALKSRNTTVRSESRRQEAKRQRSEYREGLWRKAIRRVTPSVLLIWAGFYVCAVAILLSGSESMPWRLNQTIDRDITARVLFEVEDTIRAQQAQQVARATAPNIYVANDAPLEIIRGKLTDLMTLAKSSADDKAKFQAEASAKGWELNDAEFESLQNFISSEKSKEYEDHIKRLIARLGEQTIVEKPLDTIRPEPPPNSILLSLNGESRELPTSQLQYLRESNRRYVEQTADQLVDVFPEPLRPAIASMVVETLLGPAGAKEPVYAPLWRYDEAATASKIARAVQRIKPYMIRYQKGDPIVRSENVPVLGNRELDLLKREHEEYLKAEDTDYALRQRRMLNQLGMTGLVLILAVGLASYTFFYQDRTFQKPARVVGLTGLILLMMLLSRLNERAQYPWDLPVEFSVGFVVIAAALLAIAYNQRFAFGFSGGLAILATLASRGDLALFLTLLTAMGVTVFLLREVRTRSKIIVIGVISGVAALLASIFSGLLSGQELKYVIVHGLAAGAAAVGAGFVVQGILPQFEKLFGVATSMTLLEWCDASRPLLRRMAQEAPGTYSHSLILGQMAEEAAESIGARGLLARVGALYHDIGKIQKAEYFTENQGAQHMSRHDRLSPTMSLLIIVGHVKDGIELARAYGVPRILHRFIAEHHGTTVVKYFHHAASEAAAKQKGRHCREAAESEFRYPGPKPRSKETAILMLCDGCEGAVRSVTEPTPGRIESTVHYVVMDRLNDGQFDECDITLRELRVVEQSLVKSLCAIHHGRVKYPKAVLDRERVSSGADEKSEADSTSAVSGSTPLPEVVRHA